MCNIKNKDHRPSAVFANEGLAVETISENGKVLSGILPTAPIMISSEPSMIFISKSYAETADAP